MTALITLGGNYNRLQFEFSVKKKMVNVKIVLNDH